MDASLDLNCTHYPEPCEIVIPIILKVPIVLQPEVIGKPPVCSTINGHKTVPDSQPQPEPVS